MSDAVMERPSYRVQRASSSVSWRMLAVAGGLLGLVAVGAAGWWAVGSLGGAGSVPVVEADPRPFKVRPDDPGGWRVPNQGELILERPAQRAQAGQPSRAATVAPGAEAPDIGGLRAAVAPPAPRAVVAQLPEPVAPAPAPVVAPQPVAAPVPPPVARATAGRVQVQLGALTSEEAARAEWDRLSRRAPELFQGRTPQIMRLDRGEGQAPLFRLRTGGLADQEAAAAFCEQIRARGGACVPVRS
jgi:cell division septation protein DedD